MEPESAHVVSAVSVHCLQCGDGDAARPRQHITPGPGQKFSLLTSCSNPLPLDSWEVSHESYGGSRISWFALKEFYFIPTSRTAMQATRNEDNWSTAKDHDAYKTLNGKKLSSSWCIHQSFASPRYSATPCYVAIQVPTVIDTISKRWQSKKVVNTSPSHILSWAVHPVFKLMH